MAQATSISIKQGTPNWADCATANLEAAETFYSAVFGWSSDRITNEHGSIYSLQRLDGKLVAGLFELDEEMQHRGVEPHWGTYIQVDDVRAILKRVRREGGVVLDGPVDEPGVGTIAVIRDPVDAVVRFWHPAPEHGAEVFNTAGAMTWNELNTKEPERAAAFYESVLGVTVDVMEDPSPYRTLNVDGRAVAGILETTPEMGDFPSSWDVYFASDDVDATVESVRSAGGTVLREPFDIPAMARMAVLQDPQGAVFEVIRMTSEAS